RDQRGAQGSTVAEEPDATADHGRRQAYLPPRGRGAGAASRGGGRRRIRRSLGPSSDRGSARDGDGLASRAPGPNPTTAAAHDGDAAGTRISTCGGRQTYRTRGSRKAYRTSTTRFATTMKSAAMTVTPMTAGKSFVVSDSMASCPTPGRLNTYST